MPLFLCISYQDIAAFTTHYSSIKERKRIPQVVTTFIAHSEHKHHSYHLTWDVYCPNLMHRHSPLRTMDPTSRPRSPPATQYELPLTEDREKYDRNEARRRKRDRIIVRCCAIMIVVTIVVVAVLAVFCAVRLFVPANFRGTAAQSSTITTTTAPASSAMPVLDSLTSETTSEDVSQRTGMTIQA